MASIPNIGELLLKEGLITNAQLDAAVNRHKSTEQSLARILVEMGLITESVKMSVLKKTYGYDMISLEDREIDPLVLTYIPRSFAEKHRIVPVDTQKDALIVAMEDPSDVVALDALKSLVGFRIKPCIASHDDITDAIQRYPTASVSKELKIEPSKPLWYRVVRYSAFPILAFFPLPLAIYIIGADIHNIQNYLYKLSVFDFFLYMILGWGLWAIILFEINALIFAKPEEEETPPEEKT